MSHQKIVHICKVCRKAFKTNQILRMHIRDKHTGKRIKCEKCNSSFGSPMALKYHKLNAHNDLTITHFDCKYCGKKFLCEYVMKDHVNNIHTKETLYNCELCDFTTYIKKNIAVHKKKVHIRRLTHKCEYCGKEFYNSRKLTLDNHIKNVHPEKYVDKNKGKVWPCYFCEFNAKDKQQLHNHTYNRHREENKKAREAQLLIENLPKAI